MKFHQLVAPSLTDLFVSQIEEMILSGKLKKGEKLPPERQLAAEMNVSLAVINAGATRLTQMGFLRVVPRRGIFVADYTRDGNIATMREILEHTGSRLDPDVLDPIIQFRRGVEVGAARLACKNRTEDSLAALEALVARAGAPEERENWPQVGFDFHHEIAVASANLYYPMLTQTFQPFYLMFYRRHLAMNPAVSLADELRKILACIRAGDSAAAEKECLRAIDVWAEDERKNMPAAGRREEE